jgi:hypothetical protein
MFADATTFETSHPPPASVVRHGLLLWLTFLVSGGLCVPSLTAATRSPQGVNQGGAKSIYASQIVFTPGTIQLNNAGQVTVNMTVFDSAGRIVSPTNDHPLHVNVYGVPTGVISPTESTLTSASSVTFTYNGGAFPNNMEIAAWQDDATNNGASLGTTLFVHANRPACNFRSQNYPLHVTSNVPNEIQVQAVVGANSPSGSDFKTFTIDTGSLGTIVTKSNLVMDSNVHGPGAPGQQFYDSSGYVFTGNYYLAPVSLKLKDGSYVQTNPILVLAVDGVHCHTGYSKCHISGPPNLHYLGVGFDRGDANTGSLFSSPSDNAFLELTDANNGADISGGYILSTDGVTLGITANNSSGFNMVTLDPNSMAIGDWNAVPGCYGFPSLPGAPQFCGNLLLDVGISEMFMDAPSDQWPAGSYDSNNNVPEGVNMSIQAGTNNQWAMSYSYNAVQPPDPPIGPAPTYSQWIDKSNIFVNTGRRPLLAFDYLYSGSCGLAAFKQK